MKRIKKYIFASLMAILFTLSLIPINAISIEAAEVKEMQVHYIDVGQGDATLITCDGHSMLIDTGDDTKGTAIQSYLQKQEIKKLDYLVLTSGF